MPRHRLDLSSRRFGRLLAVCPAGKTSGGKTLWHCLCDCGKAHDVAVNVLTSGRARSCGCYLKETAAKTGKASWRHNHRHIRAPRISVAQESSQWSICTVERCEEPARTRFGRFCDTHYRRNHRRGCVELPGRTPASIAPTLSVVERARLIVPRNRTPSSRLLRFNGIQLGLSDWAEASGLTKSGLQWRLRNGWSMERALTEPARARGPLRGSKRAR